jgi:hypothetical protein
MNERHRAYFEAPGLSSDHAVLYLDDFEIKGVMAFRFEADVNGVNRCVIEAEIDGITIDTESLLQMVLKAKKDEFEAEASNGFPIFDEPTGDTERAAMVPRFERQSRWQRLKDWCDRVWNGFY